MILEPIFKSFVDSEENNVITNEKYFERCLGILMAYKLSEHKSGFCIRCAVRWRLMTSALRRSTHLTLCLVDTDGN